MSAIYLQRMMSWLELAFAVAVDAMTANEQFR